MQSATDVVLRVQYRILRQKGTEPAGSGEYNKVMHQGTYRCGGCGTPLYTCAQHSVDFNNLTLQSEV